jgi:micrococcal nuclease
MFPRRGLRPWRRFSWRRGVRSPWVWTAVIGAVLLARAILPTAGPPETLVEGVYHVQRVVDGDTLLLSDHSRIRLIGANTPETVKPNAPVEPWGLEAKQFTQAFVADGAVRLQFDRERKDKYDRFLAYVWVGDRMLNEELIRAGLARAQTTFRFSAAMKNRFRRAEDEAKTAGRGIWSNRDPESAP